MRKYMEVTKLYLKMQFVWRADVVFHMLFTVTKILFAWLLWGIIFRDQNMVAGFTFDGMLSYYIISSFLTQLEMSSGISEEISSRIRNGTFSKYVILPIKIENYFLAMEVGVIAFYLLFDMAAALIWIFVFQIRFAVTRELFMLCCGLCIILLGLLFMVRLNYLLGILTLKYEEISTFLMIKNNLMALVTGSIVPLVLFPETVVRVMKLLPFYYVTYLPSMLLTGRCREEAVPGIVILLIWCGAVQAAIRRTEKKYMRLYDGVGI